MKHAISIGSGRWAAGLAAALIFAAQAVQACPGCKEVVVDGQETVSGASLGFAYSIGFMFLMVLSVLGSLGWMMFKSARLAWRPADENADYTPPK